MKIIHSIHEARNIINMWQARGERVGLVPTMGFLHEGHLSLMRQARKENDRVITSIFVNPMQFGPQEDFATYPRDFEADAEACASIPVDMIFSPTPEEMYPQGFCSHIDMHTVTEELCGKSRPTHFRGVCTVVAKLFNIIHPQRAYFGQKDAQQVAVVTRMVRDLNMDIEVVACPTVREEDGLAKSSRNAYLTEQERQAALIVSRAVFEGKRMVREQKITEARTIKDAMSRIVEQEPLAQIDYIEVVDASSMKKIETITGPTLVALAVFFGKTRLIDNFVINTFTTDNIAIDNVAMRNNC